MRLVTDAALMGCQTSHTSAPRTSAHRSDVGVGVNIESSFSPTPPTSTILLPTHTFPAPPEIRSKSKSKLKCNSALRSRERVVSELHCC